MAFCPSNVGHVYVFLQASLRRTTRTERTVLLVKMSIVSIHSSEVQSHCWMFSALWCCHEVQYLYICMCVACHCPSKRRISPGVESVKRNHGWLCDLTKIRKGAGELKCLYVHVGVAREVLKKKKKKKGITKMDISSVNSACNLNISSLIYFDRDIQNIWPAHSDPAHVWKELIYKGKEPCKYCFTFIPLACSVCYNGKPWSFD